MEITRRQSHMSAGQYRWREWNRHTLEPRAETPQQSTLPVAQLPLRPVELKTLNHPARQHSDAGTNHHRLHQTQRQPQRRRSLHGIEKLEDDRMWLQVRPHRLDLLR